MKIATYGFAEDQGKKLSRILKLSKSHAYELVTFDPQSLPDLLLLFGEDKLQAEDIAALPSGYHSRLILIDKKKPATTEYPHISYPLISSRVLAALDKLTSANEDNVEESDETENTYAKYVQQAEDKKSEKKEEVVEEDSSAGGSYRVLVVDDSKPMQQALAKELQSQFSAINIDFADEGLQALDMAENSDYDFIFLDIMMPGIDGYETCTRMRKMEKLKKLPIIMLSSKTSPLDEVKGIMAGSSTYLTKPIDSVEFQKVMARICKWVDDFAVS